MNLTNLTNNSLYLLLARLDSDVERAAAAYEELRGRLVGYFEWSCGCPESWAEDLADQTVDRVARKIEEGTQVESVRAYTLTAARYIWLEHTRKVREQGWGDEPPAVPAPSPEKDDSADDRHRCLDACLDDAIRSPADRQLILDYYDAEEGEKNKDHRKRLAERLGLDMNALKVRACRLRKSLEKCIRGCLERAAGAVTK